MSYTNEERRFFGEIDYFENLVKWFLIVFLLVNLVCIPFLLYYAFFVYPPFFPQDFFRDAKKLHYIAFGALILVDFIMPIGLYFYKNVFFCRLRDSFHKQIHAHRSVVCSSEINKAIKEIREYRESTSDINETSYDILKKLRELFNQSYELNDNLSSIISKQDDIETLHLEYKSCYGDLCEIINLLKILSSNLNATNISDFIKFLELMETKQREEYNKVLNQLNKVADDNLEEIIGLMQNAKTTLKNDINLINQVSGMIDAQIKKANTLNNSLETAMENARYFH